MFSGFPGSARVAIRRRSRNSGVVRPCPLRRRSSGYVVRGGADDACRVDRERGSLASGPLGPLVGASRVRHTDVPEPSCVGMSSGIRGPLSASRAGRRGSGRRGMWARRTERQVLGTVVHQTARRRRDRVRALLRRAGGERRERHRPAPPGGPAALDGCRHRCVASSQDEPDAVELLAKTFHSSNLQRWATR